LYTPVCAQNEAPRGTEAERPFGVADEASLHGASPGRGTFPRIKITGTF
jgi:hypothetical protein